MAILQHKPNDINEAVRRLTPMVYKLAHKYKRNHTQDFDDLLQQGFLGVVDAYNHFNPNAGAAFSSYAYTWIWAHIVGDRKVAYKTYNATSSKTPEDAMADHSYEMDIDTKIDTDRLIASADSTTRAIIAARRQGFSFREIADAMTSLGKPMTLHQARNKYLAVMPA